ncbi:uncharacterized protein LOC118648282 isoform X2 [Monomorium pharaonis]|uniref:uncharacterized protein LOC118646598 isoform X2 n=1 Tax=Monomorium pharaonis TaxID=307658 RepID=UPI001746DF51|nr:uncharacterized protein LOC118646598 isoform X2 [Monomorium pharaonis]XP_036150516.1 uncharacterized protein LOC118648282 isoform X2 [Monomorium pharaonis]
MKRIIQKKARKEKSVVIENSNATQSDKITLDSSVYLHYDILRIIFQYLHARDLASAAMVCRLPPETA